MLLCKRYWTECQSAKELKHRENIVLTNAEKGGAVGIFDVKDYIKESKRQLNHTEHYKHLEHDPTAENNATVNKVLTRIKNYKLICNNVFRWTTSKIQENTTLLHTNKNT